MRARQLDADVARWLQPSRMRESQFMQNKCWKRSQRSRKHAVSLEHSTRTLELPGSEYNRELRKRVA